MNLLLHSRAFYKLPTNFVHPLPESSGPNYVVEKKPLPLSSTKLANEVKINKNWMLSTVWCKSEEYSF